MTVPSGLCCCWPLASFLTSFWQPAALSEAPMAAKGPALAFSCLSSGMAASATITKATATQAEITTIVRRRSALCWSRRICSTTARRSRSLFFALVFAMAAAFSGFVRCLGRAVPVQRSLRSRRDEPQPRVRSVLRLTLPAVGEGACPKHCAQRSAVSVATSESCGDDTLVCGHDGVVAGQLRQGGHEVGRRRGATEAAGVPRAQRRHDGLAGTEAEHVRGLGPDQRGRTGTVLLRVEHKVGEATDDGHRSAVELALDEVGGGRELVGDRRCGDRELVTVRVGQTRVVVQRVETRRADRDVRLTLPPGTPRRVGDQHGHVLTGAAA